MVIVCQAEKKMNLLIIGLDPTAATKGEAGDLAARLIEQSKFVDNIFQICRSPKKMQPVVLSHKVTSYPVSPPLRLLYPHYAFKQAVEIIKNNKIDVIYTQDPFLCGLAGYRLRKKFKIPVIMGMHADFIDNRYWLAEHPQYWFLNILGKRLLKKADLIRSVSQEIKKKLVASGIPNGGVVVVPTGGGVDVDFFSSGSGAAVRKRYSGRDLVLFVGRLVKQKNLGLLMHAASEAKRKYPKAIFLIAGDGPEKRRLEKQKESMGLSNVIFLGKVPFKELPDYYAASDVVVLPSNYEGLPKTVEEAMAAGKPVLSTRVSGSSELVLDGETGYLVDTGDSGVFTKKLLKLLSDPSLRENMGTAGRELVRAHYDRKKNFKKMYSDLYSRGAQVKHQP